MSWCIELTFVSSMSLWKPWIEAPRQYPIAPRGQKQRSRGCRVVVVQGCQCGCEERPGPGDPGDSNKKLDLDGKTQFFMSICLVTLVMKVSSLVVSVPNYS